MPQLTTPPESLPEVGVGKVNGSIARENGDEPSAQHTQARDGLRVWLGVGCVGRLLGAASARKGC
jgi:hypothetical protein